MITETCCVTILVAVGALFIVFVPEKSGLWRAFNTLVIVLIGLTLLFLIAVISVAFLGFFPEMMNEANAIRAARA